jgi:serine protease Do
MNATRAVTSMTVLTTSQKQKSFKAIALTFLASTALAMPLAVNQHTSIEAKAEPVSVNTASAPFSFAPVVQAVSPAVVSVRTQKAAPQRVAANTPNGLDALPPNHPLRRYLERYGFDLKDFQNPQPRQPERRRYAMGQGSGFFISQDGFIVTNDHVIRNADNIEVVLQNGQSYPAELVGSDPATDLALLKVEGDDFTYVTFSEEEPIIGDWVVAVGNPFGLGGTVTAGIISAHGRDLGASVYDDYLQIDAAVNRGNSGGPSFNYKGEVIGVNTAIYSPSGGNVGIAFAIPSRTVKTIVADLKEDGKVSRGWLGVRIQNVDDDIAESLDMESPQGALIIVTDPDSPAARAGLKTGDVLLRVDEQKVEGPRELARIIGSYEPRDEVRLTILRQGMTRTLSAKLTARPDQDAS